jgi:uncharacterized protein YaaQ
MGSSISHTGLRANAPTELAGWSKGGADDQRNRTVVSLTFVACRSRNEDETYSEKGPKKKKLKSTSHFPVDVKVGSTMIGSMRHYQLNTILLQEQQQ